MYLPIGQPTLLAALKPAFLNSGESDAVLDSSKFADEKRSIGSSCKADDTSQHWAETDAFVSVRCSKDRLLMLLVRELSIALWNISPPLQLSAHRRSFDSLEQHGHNISAVWQPDSSYVAIQTSKDFVLIFFIDDSSNNAGANADNIDIDDADSVYELRTQNASTTLQTIFDAQPTIFRRTLYLSAIVPIPQGVACLEALRNELFIATNEDVIRSMRWDQQALQQSIENSGPSSDVDEDDYDSDGEVADKNAADNPAFFYLSKVPIVVDALDASRNTFYHPSIQICDCEYSFLLGGFAIVLSDGSAAFLRTSPGVDIFNASDPNKLCVQVPSIVSSQSAGSSTGAAAVYTSTSVNHRFRLMAFGCRDSTCIVCSIDDGGGSVASSQNSAHPASSGGRIVVLHRLELPRKECDQEPSRMCGAVTRVAWTSDGSALVLTWERGGMSLWSTFGSLLLFQPRWSSLLPANSREFNSLISVDWSADNYSLLLLSEKCFMKLSMVKAAWTANNVYSNRQYLLLHGDKQLLFNTGDRVVPIPELADENIQRQQQNESSSRADPIKKPDGIDASRNNNVIVKHKLFSNKLWLHLQPPEQYILPNMPLRCAAVSADGLYIACAGRTGFCYYSCAQRRWRMFGNVRQERSFFVTNALGWWHDNVVADCYNWRNGKATAPKSAVGVHEIRVYPRAENLDDAKAYVWPTPCTVLQLNVYDDLLTCFMSDGNVLLARFIRANKTTTTAQLAGADAAVTNGKSGGGFFYNPLRKRKSFTNVPSTTSQPLQQREAIVQEIQLLQIIDINNIMPHPGCVLSVDLTPVRTEASIPTDFPAHNNMPTTNATTREVESLIINVCGKLIMIQREAPQSHGYLTPSSNSSTPIPTPNSSSRTAASSNNSNSNFHLLLPGDNNPVLLASCVENFWINSSNSLHVRHSKPHLTEALWMHCGSHGLKVWLPLFPNPQERTHNFISKRIMLPTNLDIYPLAINFPDAIIHSAENEVYISSPPPPPQTTTKRLSISSMDSLSITNNSVVKSSDSSSLQSFSNNSTKTNSDAGGRNLLPYFTIHRTTEVYLPHILRQLLRRNLGVHALDIAESCRALPYFDHTLELLLHHVLEEEGGPTSSGGGANINGGLSLMAVPGNFTIPDAPLLPAVCAFVHEFDVFLDIIAHCARKTDISLWPRLFAQVGHPADLFRECLRTGKLATAASFLVVMQVQMRPSEVRPLANALLQATRMAHDADLESEMSRYLVVLELEERAELAELLGASTNSSTNTAGGSGGGGGRAQSPPLLNATPVIPYAASAPNSGPGSSSKPDPRQQQQQQRRSQQEVSSFKYGPATPTTSVIPAFHHHHHQQFRKLPSVSHHGGATQMVSDSAAAAHHQNGGGTVLTSSVSVIESSSSRRKSTTTAAPVQGHHQQLQRRITIAPSSRLQQQQSTMQMPTSRNNNNSNSNPSAMNTPPGSIVSTATGTSLFSQSGAASGNAPSNVVLGAVSSNTSVGFDDAVTENDRRQRSTKSRNRSGTADSAATNKNTIQLQRDGTLPGSSTAAAKVQRMKTSSRTMSESNAVDGENEADVDKSDILSAATSTGKYLTKSNRMEMFQNKTNLPSTTTTENEFDTNGSGTLKNTPLQAVKNGHDPYLHLFPSFSDDVGLSQFSSSLSPSKAAASLAVENSSSTLQLERSSSEVAMNRWLQTQLQQQPGVTASPVVAQLNPVSGGGSGGLMMRSTTRALPGRARMFFGNNSATNVPSPTNVPVAAATTGGGNISKNQQQIQQQFSPVRQHRNNNN